MFFLIERAVRNLKILLDMIKHNDHAWDVSGDFNVIDYFIG